jgi:hypothetical protein
MSFNTPLGRQIWMSKLNVSIILCSVPVRRQSENFSLCLQFGDLGHPIFSNLYKMAFRLSRRPSRQYIIFALLCIAIFFFVSLNITKPPTTTYPPPTRPIVDDEDTIVEYIKPEDHERLEDIRIDTTREEETAENQRNLIDRKYCGRDHCRFLLPITITEQGTLIDQNKFPQVFQLRVI